MAVGAIISDIPMVDQVDMSALLGVYAGKGKKPYHPAMLVALLFYGYATGTFSSRKLEKATYDSIAFRYLCANTHPDHDTIATFRRRNFQAVAESFLQVLLLACGCCSLIQMARHTHNDKEYPGYACTTTGLEVGAQFDGVVEKVMSGGLLVRLPAAGLGIRGFLPQEELVQAGKADL